jgi:lysophospholipase L1-like esterase
MPGNKRQNIPLGSEGKVYKRGRFKTILFSIILVLLPVIFLIIFEGILRLAGYGDRYQLFVEFEHFGKSYKTTNSEYGRKYFSQLNYTQPPNDLFLKEKPGNGFRIFVMGSSTVAGFPYNSSNAFSRVLQQRLQDSYPNHYIEVVNIAITAINSFTLYDITNQILEQEPDALLIYAGHNEFYGAMGIASLEGLSRSRFLKLAHLSLLNLRIYQLMNQIIPSVSKSISRASEDSGQAGTTLMESIAQNQSIGYESKDFNIAHDHYQKNMNSIISRAKKRGVHVFISQVVSNIRDLEPFVSIESNDYPKASTIFEQANHEEFAGNINKARELFYYAKDLDGLRFRASEQINDIIEKLATRHNATMVPMKEIFEVNSPTGIIGEDLMTEHVHPFIDGYFLMADAFYKAITESEKIASLDSVLYRQSAWYRKYWGFTALDSVFVELRLRHMRTQWPFAANANHQQSYLSNYTPESKLDSMAMMILQNQISLRNAYQLMASWHESIFNYHGAFNYTMAQARLNPHLPDNFMKAGDLLIRTNNPHLAIEMYLLSMRHARQVHQLYKTGELYLNLGNKPKADAYLSEALTIADGEVKNWIETLLAEVNRSTEITPHDENESEMIQGDNLQSRIVIFAPSEVTDKISAARSFMRQNNFDQALELLYEANKIQETPAANRFIGEILLHHNNSQSLQYLRKAYPDHQTNASFLITLCYASIVFSEKLLAQEILAKLKEIDPANENIQILESKLAEIQ